MMKIAVIFGVLFALSVVAMAQVTVTNFELEKFKRQRLAAEKDYRENHERMGFPSPEELDARRERDLQTQLAFSEQLRQERLERERVQNERDALILNAEMMAAERRAQEEAAEVEQENHNYYYGGGYNYGYGYPWWRYPRRWRRGGSGVVIIPQYRATPGGVYRGGTVIVPR
jgi:hypothetical protein